MDRAQLIKAFTATLHASLHGLQSLEPVLQHEQVVLTGKDPDAVGTVAGEKLALLKQLEHSVQARDRLQKAAGFAAGMEGGGQLVEAVADPALRDDWNAVVALGKRIVALNDRNGQLVLQGQRTTRTALGILTGRPQRDDTYSGLRRRHAGVDSYTLGKV